MKTHTFEISNKDSFTWFILLMITGIILAHLSVDKFEWKIFFEFANLAIAPAMFITLFGKKIEQ